MAAGIDEAGKEEMVWLLFLSEAVFPSLLEPVACSFAFSALTTGARRHSLLLLLLSAFQVLQGNTCFVARQVARPESPNTFVDAHHSFRGFREIRKPRDYSMKNAGLQVEC